MFDQVKSHPEWKLLFEKYKDSDYGTFIPHSEIERILGYERKKAPEKYYGFVNRWKMEMLKQTSRQIECLNSKGYHIIEPDQFRASAKRQLKFGQKRIKKAGEIVLNAPIGLMSEEEKKKLRDTGVILAEILYFSKATMKKVKEIDKKTDQLLLDVGKALDVSD